jgi:hypothetical protein
VDPKAAFAQLGLEAPTSAEAIRRAYLRAVRQHSPERDPEGFQRVRAAYDCLRNAPWLWAAQPEEAPASSPAGDLGREPLTTWAEAAPADVLLSAPGSADGEAQTPEEAQAAEEAELEDLNGLGGAVLSHPVPIWQPLEEALRLLEAGELDRARAIVEALEQRTNALGVRPREMGAFAIARWTLVSELLALEGVATGELIGALAEGVSSGDFDEAKALFDTEHKRRYWRGHRPFAAKAPHLYKKLAGTTPPRFRSGFTTWRSVWLVFVVIQLARICTGPELGSRHRQTKTDMVASDSKGQGRREDPVDRHVAATTTWIDEAVRVGDCNTVRQQWPYYAAEARNNYGGPLVLQHYAERRRRVVAMCAELERELTESP